MYEERPWIEAPHDAALLWRYMDVARFVDLLHRRQLWFSTLHNLEDAFEGRWPKKLGAQQQRLRQPLRELLTQLGVHSPLTPGPEEAHARRLNTAVNCWFCSPTESAAMWSIYGANGVAVGTTVLGLKKSFARYEPAVLIGKVDYIDFSTADLPLENIWLDERPAYLKRDHYRHEQEVRAMVRTKPDAGRAEGL